MTSGIDCLDSIKEKAKTEEKKKIWKGCICLSCFFEFHPKGYKELLEDINQGNYIILIQTKKYHLGVVWKMDWGRLWTSWSKETSCKGISAAHVRIGETGMKTEGEMQISCALSTKSQLSTSRQIIPSRCACFCIIAFYSLQKSGGHSWGKSKGILCSIHTFTSSQAPTCPSNISKKIHFVIVGCIV